MQTAQYLPDDPAEPAWSPTVEIAVHAGGRYRLIGLTPEEARAPYARDRGATTELAMALEAAVAAIRDAGLTAADIDGVVGGGLLTGGIDPATVVSALGLPAVTWWARAAPPIMNHLVAAVNAVWTGACEVALVYHSVYRVGGFSRSANADPFRRRAAFGLPDGRAPLCLYDMDVPVDGADAFIVTTAGRPATCPPRRSSSTRRPWA